MTPEKRSSIRPLKVMRAMAAGVTDRLWEVSDMVNVLETWEIN